jgi:hypothetical protein
VPSPSRLVIAFGTIVLLFAFSKPGLVVGVKPNVEQTRNCSHPLHPLDINQAIETVSWHQPPTRHSSEIMSGALANSLSVLLRAGWTPTTLESHASQLDDHTFLVLA